MPFYSQRNPWVSSAMTHGEPSSWLGPWLGQDSKEGMDQALSLPRAESNAGRNKCGSKELLGR